MFSQLQSMEIILLIIVILLNLNSFTLFYRDKKRSQKYKYRIPEKTLLFSAFFFGGIGAFLGMNILRHKTKHLSFKISVPIAMLITVFSLYQIII